MSVCMRGTCYEATARPPSPLERTNKLCLLPPRSLLPARAVNGDGSSAVRPLLFYYPRRAA